MTPQMPSHDPTPRIAIVTSYAPEWQALRAELARQAIPVAIRTINGIDFATADIAGRAVVIYLSGMSMVNAAMSAQLALDRFNISAIILSGIAGSADPALNVGDVILPARWGQYLESVMARETQAGFAPPPFLDGFRVDAPNFGMMHPLSVEIAQDGQTDRPRRFWFNAAPRLLEAARAAAGIALETGTDAGHQLSHIPRVIIGGNGLSGPAFVDNAALRIWAHETFDAQVLDMESAAVAHVARANGRDFIAVRSVSDLAGGGASANEMATFMGLAATNSVRVVMALIAAIDPTPRGA
ncbi:5'-methylthioadenosine/S-adenosylhomocysteine nucleosidase [Paracoccus sp. DMF-8]|uniref:5'-methylthioadenosine/S-adenosylhomocysteine nucleosidase n=1 Tax=Paracoccus sp. DMF-8 TaxID=3019445 RepID=UPI0023E81820|nr:5'-methylthioadenosine/S-adenosylhomocysteine nucleosidase [Paracoccus sp. DMF-8]MDF3605960.1 5'-methylthioadenosine/S-adenosylhomocysteine nucleosidase [Paracoccus sp. DMF-8]